MTGDETIVDILERMKEEIAARTAQAAAAKALQETQVTVGIIVHYHTEDPPDGPRAAVVTFVHADGKTCNLSVFATGEDDYDSMYPITLHHDVAFAPTPRVGHWSWPPRAP